MTLSERFKSTIEAKGQTIPPTPESAARIALEGVIGE